MTNKKFLFFSVTYFFPYSPSSAENLTCVCAKYLFYGYTCYYNMRVSMCIYLRSSISAAKTQKAIPHATLRSFLLMVLLIYLFIFSSEKSRLVSRGEKKVKYYFPPPLFEFSELNRISFLYFFFFFRLCVCLFILFFFFLAWEPCYSSVWLRFCQMYKQ